jgi:hypothetical protein
MTVATYTSDLTDITLFESTTGIGNYGGGGGAAGAGIDYAIEGTNAIDKQVNATERGFLFTAGSSFTIGADDHFYEWVVVGTYGIADTRDNRGIAVAIGDGTGDFVQFHVNGGDTLPLGGMVPYAVRFVNTSSTNLRTLVGTPGTSPDSIGCTANITGAAKFANLAADACRIGTGYDILNGTGADPEADFAGIAADDLVAREGILVAVPGGYSLQGKLRIGSASTACEFLDINTNLLLVDTIHSLGDFTEILVEHADSILTLTNVNIQGLGTTNPGRFEMLTDTATATLFNVGFIDFADTVLGSNSTFTSCRWINSDIVSANGADLSGSDVLTPNISANTSGLIWNTNTDPNGLLDDMTFSKTSGTAHHAIEFGTSIPTSDITLTGCAFGTDFSGGLDTTVGDETFHFLDTTGTITLNLSGCTGNKGYRSEGVVVTIVDDPVLTEYTVTDAETPPVAISGARVFLETSDNTGPLPFEEAVTITQTAGTATVTHTGHGIPDATNVVIRGADQNGYNKVGVITVTSANEYTYAVDSGTVSPSTGTEVASGVIIHGTTNGSGVISDTRVFSGDQPFKGSIRDSSGSPFHQAATVTGDVSSTTGFSATIALLSDE